LPFYTETSSIFIFEREMKSIGWIPKHVASHLFIISWWWRRWQDKIHVHFILAQLYISTIEIVVVLWSTWSGFDSEMVSFRTGQLLNLWGEILMAI